MPCAVYFTVIIPRVQQSISIKGIVHFEINFWYVLAYLRGIQDVGVFVSTVVSFFIFLGQTVLVCHIMQVYGHHLKEHAQRSPI